MAANTHHDPSLDYARHPTLAPISRPFLRCSHCGSTNFGFLLPALKPMCKGCGHETSLEKVSNIHMHCTRCGFTGKYRTNRVEKDIQMECLNCSDIVYLTRIRRGNYVPEAEATE